MTALKECKAYMTSDGVPYASKSDALQAQFRIDVQGVFNRNGSTTRPQFTAGEVAGLIAKNLEEVRDLLAKYSAARNRIERARMERSALTAAGK